MRHQTIAPTAANLALFVVAAELLLFTPYSLRAQIGRPANSLTRCSTSTEPSQEVVPVTSGAGTTSEDEAQDTNKPPRLPAGGVLPSTPSFKMTYTHGVMTLRADGASLQDIISAYQDKVGANISGPSTREIIYANLCGAADTIFAELLAGSDLEYVILSAPHNPGEVREIRLSHREANTPDLAAQGTSSQTAAKTKRSDARSIGSLRPEYSGVAVEAAQGDPAATAVAVEVPIGRGSRLPANMVPFGANAGTSAVSQADNTESNEPQVNPAGKFLQELYRARQTVPSADPPSPR